MYFSILYSFAFLGMFAVEAKKKRYAVSLSEMPGSSLALSSDKKSVVLGGVPGRVKVKVSSDEGNYDKMYIDGLRICGDRSENKIYVCDNDQLLSDFWNAISGSFKLKSAGEGQYLLKSNLLGNFNPFSKDYCVGYSVSEKGLKLLPCDKKDKYQFWNAKKIEIPKKKEESSTSDNDSDEKKKEEHAAADICKEETQLMSTKCQANANCANMCINGYSNGLNAGPNNRHGNGPQQSTFYMYTNAPSSATSPAFVWDSARIKIGRHGNKAFCSPPAPGWNPQVCPPIR